MWWRIKNFLTDLFLTIFYEVSKVEYFQIKKVNSEFVIFYYTSKIPVFPRKTVILRSIGASQPFCFKEEIEDCKKHGTPITTWEVTLQEFTNVARNHSALLKDSWVQMRIQAVDKGIARR